MNQAHSALISEWHFLSKDHSPHAESRMAAIEEKLKMHDIRPDTCKPDKDWQPPERKKLKIEDHYTPEFLAKLGEWERKNLEKHLNL